MTLLRIITIITYYYVFETGQLADEAILLDLAPGEGILSAAFRHDRRGADAAWIRTTRLRAVEWGRALAHPTADGWMRAFLEGSADDPVVALVDTGAGGAALPVLAQGLLLSGTVVGGDSEAGRRPPLWEGPAGGAEATSPAAACGTGNDGCDGAWGKRVGGGDFPKGVP